MKRILIIDNSVAVTGAFKCALQEAELLRNGLDFIFVLPAKSMVAQLVTDKGFTCYLLPLREINRSFKNNLLYFPALLKNAVALKKILKKESIEVIQVNDFYNLLGSCVKLWGFKGKLITYVRFLPAARPSILSRCWSWMAARFSYRVVCVSEAVRKQMPAKKNIIRIYDSVFFEENYPPEKADKDGIILLYLANYIPGKGQQYALDAFAAAYKKNLRLCLRFVGGDMGLEKNKKYKDELIRKAMHLGIDGVTEFAGFSNDIEKEIIASDIVLNFSESESFSMTCAEASFYQRPVIATRCGGPGEIIVNQESGILVEKGNISQMSESILMLASDAEKRKRFGKFGRNYVKQKFSPQNFIRTFTEMV